MEITNTTAGALRVGVGVVQHEHLDHACKLFQRTSLDYEVIPISDGQVRIEVPMEQVEAASSVLRGWETVRWVDFVITLLSDAAETLSVAMNRSNFPAASREIYMEQVTQIGAIREEIQRELNDPTVDHKYGRLSDWVDLEH